MAIRTKMLASAAFLLPLATSPASGAQDAQSAPIGQPAATEAAAQPSEDFGEEEEIVVTGQRARGSVIGDIPPEDTLDSRDVRATGATSINELLDALAPQIGSTQGRGGERPILLLNGQRISSFRELRDIPTEAIQRVEILPEEVALKYGYAANQKVVNIVLRQRFRSTVAEARANAATEGGYAGGTGDLTRLMIQRNGRTQLNLHAEGNGILTQNERNIVPIGTSPTGDPEDLLAARSLIARKRDVRGSSIFNRQILGNVSATLNTEIEHSEGHSLIGLGDITLEPLARDTTANSAHAGVTLNWDKSEWHWNITGNADCARNVTETERDNPDFRFDRARDTTTSGDFTVVTNGNLFKVPAGNAGATFRMGASTQHLDSANRVAGLSNSNSLSRTEGDVGANFDLPVSRRGRDFSALGNLTLNANAEVNQLSDFGTLTVLGGGANWSPVDRLSFVTSWTREEGAPTVNQLGDPLLSTPNTQVFDFTTGQTVLVTAITGGNPGLDSDRRNVFKLGGYWQPIEKIDLRLRADYVHQRVDRPISNISITPQIEQAFPERFLRDGAGQLIAVDFTPINFDNSRRETLRLGFDFTKPLKSRRPSQAVIDQMRQQFGFGGRARTQGATSSGSEGGPPPGPPESGSRPEGGGGFGGGRGGGGGGFGGGSRGRLQFSLTDTLTFVDKVTIAPGVPEVDYLHGDAASSLGGTPRHQVQAQAGWSNNGFGARLGANWRSGTHVNTLGGDDLDFSSIGTFDLRLFANLGEQPELTLKHPLLRGSSVRLEATNILDSKPKVRDASGNVPLNYQADLLDPLGRTVMISFRKLFLPPRSFFQRERQGQGSPGGTD